MDLNAQNIGFEPKCGSSHAASGFTELSAADGEGNEEDEWSGTREPPEASEEPRFDTVLSLSEKHSLNMASAIRIAVGSSVKSAICI